jgi:hypothetical protein
MANPYADRTNVQTYLNELGGPGVTFNATSHPNSTEVDSLVDEIAADVNAVLIALGYSAPASGANDILLIKRYVSMKAACEAFKMGFMGDQLPAKVVSWCESYDKFIDRLLDGDYSLIDQTGFSGTGYVLVGAYTGDDV